MPTEELDDYPYYHLETTIEKLGVVHKMIGIDNMTRDVVAETLDMSATGGAFTNLISSMDKYGLVETAWGGKVTITDLGKEVIYGSASEVEKAKIKAFFNIKLFESIYNRYGYDATEDQIRAFLRQEANVDIAKAQSKANQAYRIYRNFLDSINPSTISKELSSDLKAVMKVEPEIPIVEPESEDLVIQFGRVFIRLPKDDLVALGLAKQAIEMMEGIVKSKLGQQ